MWGDGGRSAVSVANDSLGGTEDPLAIRFDIDEAGGLVVEELLQRLD